MTRSPAIQQNWNGFLGGQPYQGAYELLLHTDARVTGTIEKRNGGTPDIGPYELVNTVPMGPAEFLVAQPHVALRISLHGSGELRVPDMTKPDKGSYHGAGLADEVAALVSLELGIRLKAGKEERRFLPGGEARGHPIQHDFPHKPVLRGGRSSRPMVPEALGNKSLNDIALLSSIPVIEADAAAELVRAARLFQDALWMVDEQPHLAWLLLVSAIEVAASHHRESSATAVERLRDFNPKLDRLLLAAGGDTHRDEVARMIVDLTGAQKKVLDFIEDFFPDAPDRRPPENFRLDWSRESVQSAVRVLYGHRSKALHAGVPFPAPLCSPVSPTEAGVLQEVPLAHGAASGGGVWTKDQLPMLLHVFTYVARGSLLKWWASLAARP